MDSVFRGIKFCFYVAFVILMLWLWGWVINGFVSLNYPKYIAMEAECKSQLHTISTALERYAKDHNGDYPSDISLIQKEGYLEKLPINPFSVRENREMRNIDFFGEQTEGDFSYIPFETSEGIIGFHLLVYGSNEAFEKGPKAYRSPTDVKDFNGRTDLDHDGVIDNVVWCCSSDTELPPLQTILERLKKNTENPN